MPLSGRLQIAFAIHEISQYCGHFFDFERIFVRLKFVSDYLSTSYKFQYLFA